MYKAAIFDLDGTLADTIESIARACNKTLLEYGFLPRETKEYQYFAGDGADTLVKRAFMAAGDIELQYFNEAYESYKNFFQQDCMYQVTVFEGVRETLDQLKKAGILLGVVSNKPHERTITVVETLFGQGYFDKITGHIEGQPKKPDPVLVWKTAEDLGVQPEECIYVGDTDVDMITGNRAGMYTVGVLWGFRTKEELVQNHAHKIISKPEELMSLLKFKEKNVPR